MGTAKRQRAIEKRKKTALKLSSKSTFKKVFNDNKDEVIAKMIEFGVYEKSLEHESWFVVHGKYLFTWQDGEYSYMYTTKPREIAKLVAIFETYCEK